MCGIAGIVSAESNLRPDRAMVARMNAALAHRGPDGEDIWCEDGVAFGHRRLSIIDLSPLGTQPMTSADGRFVMVCNGEIYNFKNIRKQFEAEHYPFRSHTDVEVILPLYERYGERCVDYLVGMFAFAVWDRRERSLFLARDRIGEKPLYFWTKGKAIAFASEVKGLLELPGLERKLDVRALAQLQVFQSLPAPFTMFEGIEALPPATTLTWSEGKHRQQRYWRVDYSRRRSWSWDDALDAYDEHLQRSVAGCLIADVPVGLTLSGGVDSSAIASATSRQHADIRSFCIGHMPNGEPDIEQRRAGRVASILGLDHKNLDYALPQFADLSRVLRQYDQPIWSGAAFYADRLAQTMRNEVKVAIGGNGADEVLAGYSAYARLPFEDVVRQFANRLPNALRTLAKPYAGERFARLIDTSAGPMETWRASVFTEAARQQIRRLCTPTWAERLGALNVGASVHSYAEECSPSSYLDTVLYTDLMVHHQHGHCTISDVAGMTYGLEIRAPFLDHRLIEFVASLPSHMLLSRVPAPQRTKYIAKRHLRRYLPRDIVQAPKVGFGYAIPINDLVQGPTAQEARKRITEGRYLDLGIFSREGAEWALDNSLTASWMLLSFSLWVDIYL